MHRVLSLVTAMLISLFVLVPAAAAADPWGPDEHLILSTAGDVTLPAGQHVDLLVVVDGTATIRGDARSVIVVNGTADFVGGRSGEVIAVRGRVVLDATSVVTGDIRTFESTVDRAAGATLSGSVGDLGPLFADWWSVMGIVGVALYVSFVFFSLIAGLALAGIAARQVREAEAIVSREPALAILASLVGFAAIITAGIVAMVTIIGIPLGFAILLGVLPALLLVSYLVAGIWLGNRILERTSPGVVRERPYLASFVGLVVLGAIGWIPFVGGIAVLVGFGAVSVQIWRVLRGQPRERIAAAQPVAVASGS